MRNNDIEQNNQLTNQEWCEMLGKLNKMNKEEAHLFLTTPKGKMMVQEFTKTIFLKDNNQ